MPAWKWLAAGSAAAVAIYAVLVVLLIILGRRSDARAIARFIPDCIALFRDLLRDPRVPRSRKWLVGALLAYLAMPIDLVPDFIPIAGQLDDALAVVLVLRALLRSGGPTLLRDHWKGPPATLDLLLRFAYGRAT